MASPEWKRFERLIASIEELLKPAGYEVLTATKIPDVRGFPREVDAVIRPVGGTQRRELPGRF